MLIRRKRSLAYSLLLFFMASATSLAALDSTILINQNDGSFVHTDQRTVSLTKLILRDKNIYFIESNILGSTRMSAGTFEINKNGRLVVVADSNAMCAISNIHDSVFLQTEYCLISDFTDVQFEKTNDDTVLMLRTKTKPNLLKYSYAHNWFNKSSKNNDKRMAFDNVTYKNTDSLFFPFPCGWIYRVDTIGSNFSIYIEVNDIIFCFNNLKLISIPSRIVNYNTFMGIRKREKEIEVTMLKLQNN